MASETLHKVCAVCGKKFDTPRSNPRITCSKECEAVKRSRKGVHYPSLQMDVTGQTYGELTAVKRLDNGRWLWRCSCGQEVTALLRSVRNGKQVSCGHVLAQKAAERIAEGVLGDYDGTRISTLQSIVNGKIRKNNTSGANGVKVRKYPSGRVAYQAVIMLRGVQKSLGTFNTLEEAKEARKEAEKTYFGEVMEKYKKENGIE